MKFFPLALAAALALGSASAFAADAIDHCVDTGACAFKVWGAGLPEPKMSFWVLESEWRKFDSTANAVLKKRLEEYVSLMRANPENYAANRSIGAGVPRSSPAFPLIVQNIRGATSWTIFLSPGKGPRGALIQGREITFTRGSK